MSNTKEGRYKLRLHVSVTYYLEYGLHLACHRRRHAQTPTSNTFAFVYGYGAPLSGPSKGNVSCTQMAFTAFVSCIFRLLLLGETIYRKPRCKVTELKLKLSLILG